MTANRPYIVGLTGGIACGKSNLSEVLRSRGAVVVDADEISRAFTAEGGRALPAIRARFGDQVFEGELLNRRALSDAVFGHPRALADLNALMHPMVFEEIDDQIARHADRAALVIDIPLLYETGFEARCDEVWCAYAPPAHQVQRLLQRGMTREEALRRIDSQMPAMEKAKRSDRVIITTGDKADNANHVIRLWDALLRRI